MTRQRLAPMDTLFLRMEDPTNPMMVTGVIVFESPVDPERLRETIETRLLVYDRFRQRVAFPRPPRRTPYWQDDADFDLGYHLRRVTLPQPGDQAALQKIVSQLASTPLDLTRPLWQLHLVDVSGDESTTSPQDASTLGGCALIFRLHHGFADGMALVQVLLSVADTDAKGPQPGTLEESVPTGDKTRHRAAKSLVGKGLGLLTHPRRAANLARSGAEAVITLGELVLLPPDSNPAFRGELGMTKRAAWSDPISLQDVKLIGRRLGGTVNDVLLSAMTGALRRYLGDRGQSLDDDASLTAGIAVNLRPPGTEAELGNQLGFVYLSLPIEMADPADRLRELKRRMDRHKDSLEAPVGLAALKAIGMVPANMQTALVRFLGSKTTVVVTNVVGPREPLYLAGAPIEQLMFWVPQSGGVGVGVSILSYAGRVWLGVLVDEGLVSDPEAIIAGFQAEFDALLALALETEETPSMSDLMGKLEDTLIRLDAILDGDAGEPDSASKASSAASQ